MQPAENPMQCPACGAVFPEGSKFCRIDGTPLVAAVTATPPPGSTGGANQSRTALVVAVVAVIVAVAGAGLYSYRSRSASEPGERAGAGAPADSDGTSAAGITGTQDPAGSGAGASSGSGSTTAVVPETESENPQSARSEGTSKTRAVTQASKCRKPACFEILNAKITPAAARPGQTVRCTARYTFRHNEGGHGPLQVEESLHVGIRHARNQSRRVDNGFGPNLFDLSFTIPDRAEAGTYPVTLSVRRRRITESVKLQIVVRE